MQMRNEIEKRISELNGSEANSVSGDQKPIGGGGGASSSTSFVPLLRLRVMDILGGTTRSDSTCTAMLTFWKPSEELRCILTENSCFRVTNVSVGYAHRSGIDTFTQQLKATKSTRVDFLKTIQKTEKCDNNQRSENMARKIVSIHDILEVCNNETQLEVSELHDS